MEKGVGRGWSKVRGGGGGGGVINNKIGVV